MQYKVFDRNLKVIAESFVADGQPLALGDSIRCAGNGSVVRTVTVAKVLFSVIGIQWLIIV